MLLTTFAAVPVDVPEGQAQLECDLEILQLHVIERASVGVVREFVGESAIQLPSLCLASRLRGAALRGTLWRMATPLTVSIPHQLGRAEARRRIETGFAQIVHLLPGSGGACSESWDRDRLTFRVAAVGQAIEGVIDVGDAAVTIVIELPGVLGIIANNLKNRLQKVGQLLLTKQ